MPSCSKAVHPSGVEIIFTEEDHKYRSVINGNEVSYVSGTQFLGGFFPPFDPTGKITERCALKEGLTVDELKRKWDEKKNKSCRLGTRMHETIEDCLNGVPYRNTAEDDEEKRRFANAKEIGAKLRKTVDLLGIEKIVFSPDLRIAGTIDLLAKSRKDGSYLIIDHKSNADIPPKDENRYGKFCLGPISHLPDTAYWHYACQLNLYAYLLKREKYVPAGSRFRFFLNHVLPESYRLIELPELQVEIRDLVIEHLLKTRS